MCFTSNPMLALPSSSPSNLITSPSSSSPSISSSSSAPLQINSKNFLPDDENNDANELMTKRKDQERALSNGKIGMDASIMPTKYPDIKLVQTTDFFYPLVDDPYMQGRITCANVLSDLYAMGVTDCDNMLMLLGISRKLEPDEKEIVTKLMMQGFNDLAIEAGTMVTGGQTVVNPWYVVGGVASAVVKESEIIYPTSAVPGDVLVLTKPLGTQVAVNAHQWLGNEAKFDRIKHVISEEDVIKVYDTATLSMARLNRQAARLMHKYGCHACTDVTGFGIMGHANNLVSTQLHSVSFRIHTLPLLKAMDKIVNALGGAFKLLQGRSAETSGGLLLALPKENAQDYIDELQRLEGWPAWIIGDVTEGPRIATLIETPKIVYAQNRTYKDIYG
ncbi:AIR synthase-related protein [Paraphysoderma sedebokerense]|nr:AIR synthase-related protein [Paraphysoderma sedebokerense]